MKFYGLKDVLIRWRAYLVRHIGKEGSAVVPMPTPDGDRYVFEVDLTDVERLQTSQEWVEGGYADRLEFSEDGIGLFDED